MIKAIKILLRKVKNRIYPSHKSHVINKSSILNHACKFVVNERIKGDYYEFGVFQGATLISAYWLLKQMHERKTGSDPRYTNDAWENMVFHAYDSFEGLPQLSDEDKYSEDFKEGQYACDEKFVQNNLITHKVDIQKVRFYKGWFEQTCNPANFKITQPQKACIIWLDCDLYSSACDVFRLISCLIQDGTVLVIDDWFSSKGSPFHGVQKAFYEWLPSVEKTYFVHEYCIDSWKRKSFIVSEKP